MAMLETVTTSWAAGLGELGVRAAETGILPDSLIRVGMDRLIASRLRSEAGRSPGVIDLQRAKLWSGPIATNTDEANQQHYELPEEFFELVLGARRKYSSGYWPEGVTDLNEAEEAMLELYGERAGLADGQRVLDLGCGWGSFTLWAAERYPRSEIVGVSNSISQKRHIERLAQDAGLANVVVITRDINAYQPQGAFDRIVSIEMMEHVRNHRELFRRVRSWLGEDGAAFVHVFAHQKYEYPYEVSGPGSWMAGTFFTGGMMPSTSLIPAAAGANFHTEQSWWIDGTHYSRTLEAWLLRMDRADELVREVLEPVYGVDLELWIQRWRMFFMACSQMFRYRDGTEWGISHHLLRPS